jgi:hypothetical protein
LCVGVVGVYDAVLLPPGQQAAYTVNELPNEEPTMIIDEEELLDNQSYGGMNYNSYEGGVGGDYYIPQFHLLEGFVSADEIHRVRNEWIAISGQPPSQVREWFQEVLARMLPHVVGHRSCLETLHMYRAERDRLPLMGTLVGCGGGGGSGGPGQAVQCSK